MSEPTTPTAANSTSSEIRPAGKRGRKPDPNKLRFVSVGFTPAQRDWLRLWRSNPDDPAPAPGDDDDNPTQQLQMMLETVMRFFPDGNAFHTWPRGEGGRFAKRCRSCGAAVGTTADCPTCAEERKANERNP